MKRAILIASAVALVVSGVALGGPERRVALHPSLEKDTVHAIDIGLRWLKGQQAEEGHWSLKQYPAMTGLVVWACLREPGRPVRDVPPHVRKGLAFIANCANPDGSIARTVNAPRGRPLRTYNTALCMEALAASADSKYEDIVKRARKYLIKSQRLEPGVYYGGLGYDAEFRRKYADMNNTCLALEAMKYTTFVVSRRQHSCAPPVTEKELGAARDQEKKKDYDDVNWKAAATFLRRCQNTPSDDPKKYVSLTPKDRGGFFYEPNRGQAGAVKHAKGERAWNSHGVASYGGLLCLLYADLKRDDPSVEAAVGWIRRNYTLDEHPGCGQQGLYFYYLTMAKALSVYGEEPLKLADGREVDWRTELAKRIVSLQRIEAKTGLGYWKNDNGRWMENNPVLTTAYEILALETLLGRP